MYMVRPTMEPVKSPVSFCFIFAGSSQLLVGPASSLLREQMKVRSSTRATSAGSDRTRTLFGRFAGSRGIAVPVRVINRRIAWYSSGEPSHQCTRSGLHNFATSSTHRASLGCLWSWAAVSTSIVVLAIVYLPVASCGLQDHARKPCDENGRRVVCATRRAENQLSLPPPHPDAQASVRRSAKTFRDPCLRPIPART